MIVLMYEPVIFRIETILQFSFNIQGTLLSVIIAQLICYIICDNSYHHHSVFPVLGFPMRSVAIANAFHGEGTLIKWIKKVSFCGFVGICFANTEKIYFAILLGFFFL